MDPTLDIPYADTSESMALTTGDMQYVGGPDPSASLPTLDNLSGGGLPSDLPQSNDILDTTSAQLPGADYGGGTADAVLPATATDSSMVKDLINQVTKNPLQSAKIFASLYQAVKGQNGQTSYVRRSGVPTTVHSAVNTYGAYATPTVDNNYGIGVNTSPVFSQLAIPLGVLAFVLLGSK